MADRTDFYFRQRVTEAELDLAFALLEQADRSFASDIGVFGILTGALPTPHAPVADLTIDLTAPGRAYDRLGQRIAFGTGQRVDCSVDMAGVPTEVKGQAAERWLGVFLRFTRQLSDPRTDGNSQPVYFRRDEWFELVVRQGVEAPAGAAVPVALQDGELLVCDVKRAAGKTQVLAADIDVTRRQAFVFARATAVEVEPDTWKVLAPAKRHVQATLDAADGVLADHLAGATRRHAADAIDVAPHGFLASKTVGAALAELVDALLSVNAPAGSARLGADAIPGQPMALGAGSVRSQLAQLLGAQNAHVGALAGAHPASAITGAPFAFVAAGSVQAQLQAIVAGLAAPAGAALVGGDAVIGKPYALAAGTVHAQLTSALGQLNQLVADLAAVTAGLGAAKVGNEALTGAPKTHVAGPVHAQLQGLCDDINAHVASGDHDLRYLRVIHSNSQLYNPGQTIAHGDIQVWPALITTYYATNISGTDSSGPFLSSGPFAAQIVASVAIPNGIFSPGYQLSVQNTSGVPLYIVVNVYRVGS